MSNRITGRIVGILFLVAFVCYGAGSALVDRPFGVSLMLLNSVVVATIGALVFRVLRRPHAATAAIYLLARSIEAVLLAVGAVLLVWIGSANGNDFAYQAAMLVLGLGSLPFCYLLFRNRIVPRSLSLWGMVGYAVLASGALLELLGFALGLVLSIPGGFFEVAFGLILIARGFPEPVGTPPTTRTQVVNVRLGAGA